MKIAIRTCIWIAGFIFIVIAFIAFILVYAMPALGERQFLENYGPKTPYYIVEANGAIANSFGGRLGLSRLERISHDPSVSLVGQNRAKDIVNYVRSGQHVNDLKEFFERTERLHHPISILDRYAYFILWRENITAEQGAAANP